MEITEVVEPEAVGVQLAKGIHPYIDIGISREAGAGGSDVMKRVGSALNLAIIDRELLVYYLVINTEFIDTKRAAEIMVDQWHRHTGSTCQTEEIVHE